VFDLYYYSPYYTYAVAGAGPLHSVSRKEIKVNGMDTLRNTGARHAQLHAMPRVWIAAKEYGRLDAMQLRSARNVSHLLRPLPAVQRTREAFEPGFG
jgi:hypothetical protein